jgi:sialic acid synthase SpsE
MNEVHLPKSVFITGEIGINHNGDIEIAKKLIDVAAVAGVSAVKFQKRTPEKCVPDSQKNLRRQTPWGIEMTYLEYRHRIEFQKAEYDIIDAHCKSRGIEWYASPWDMDSFEFLLQYKPGHHKIASALLTHVEMLEAMARTGPAKNEELNLNCIPSMQERYKCPVGYSGHEFGLLPTILAVVLGATAIERHITLNRTMIGSDHLASVEPVGLMKLVAQIKTATTVMGDGVKRVMESELPIREKLRNVK